MAFSFGASSSSTPSLFGGSASGFGAPASTPSLFGSSTPAFGASSGTGLFGASSTPAFGASSTPSLFGGSFAAASSTPSLFGSTSALGQSGGAFSFSTGSSLFGSTPALGQSQAAFGFGQQSAPSFGAQPQAAVQGGIATVDNKQITHYTRWEEINPAGQNQLLQMERRLNEMKEESRQLEQCARLQDTHPDQPGSAEATLRHNLKGLASSWLGDEEEVIALNERVHDLLHATEVAVRTFQRSYQWREVAKAGQGQALQPAVREMLSAPVALPSKYLQKSIEAFKKNIEQYVAIVSELEKLLPMSSSRKDGRAQNQSADDLLTSIPAAIQNMSDLFKYASARIATLHDRVETAREQHVQKLRQEGDYRDPFQEAERQMRASEDASRSRSPSIPPSHSDGNSAQHAASNGQLLLTNASPSPAAGGNAFGVPASSGMFGGQAFGGGGFGDIGQQKATNSRKTKSKK